MGTSIGIAQETENCTDPTETEFRLCRSEPEQGLVSFSVISGENESCSPSKLPGQKSSWWEFFYEWGDGTYTKTQSPECEDPEHNVVIWQALNGESETLHSISHEYKKNSPASKPYKVILKSTPIKSGSNELPDLIRSLDIDDAGDTEDPSNFLPASTEGIKLDVRRHVITSFDSTTVIVMYRNTGGGIGREGEVRLYVPGETNIDPNQLDARFYTLNSDDPTPTFEEGEDEQGKYLFWSVAMDAGEEHSVFIDLLPNDEDNSENSIYQFWAGLSWDDEQPSASETFFDCFGYMIGLNLDKKRRQDGSESVDETLSGSPCSSPVEYADSDSESQNIRINRARDPNSIHIFPNKIYPGKKTRSFNVRVNFENESKEVPVYNIVLIPGFDSLKFDLNSTRSLRHHPTFCSNHPHDIPSPTPEKGVNWGLSQNLPNPSFKKFYPKWRFLPLPVDTSASQHPCIVLNPVPNSGLLEDATVNQGFLSFRLNSNEEHKFKRKDTVWVRANVIFNPWERNSAESDLPSQADRLPDHDTLTAPAYIAVVRRPFRWRGFGLKFGGNQEIMGDSVWRSLSLRRFEGWHAGITYKRKLSFLPLQSLYGQGELLLNRHSFSFINSPLSYKNWMIDIPVQVRYVPKLGYAQFLAISGGYIPSITISSTQNDKEVPFQSFSQRFQQAYFLDASIGNILGKYGISIGLRYTSYLPASDLINLENYKKWQLYIHYNL